jgi:hypothetical protein
MTKLGENSLSTLIYLVFFTNYFRRKKRRKKRRGKVENIVSGSGESGVGRGRHLPNGCPNQDV